MKLFLRSLAIAVFAFITHTSFAADKVASFTIATATPTNILSGGKYVITDILFFNGTNVTTSTKLYDSTGVTTNYVQGAYTNYSTISTNWSTTFTNATGIIVTNTFTGITHVPTANAASTNELPAKFLFLTAGSGSRQVSGLAIQPARGIVVYSTGPGTLEIGYRQIEP